MHARRTLLPGLLLFMLSAAAALAQPLADERLTIRLSSMTTLEDQHLLPHTTKPVKGDTIDFRDLLLNRVPQFGKATGRAVAWDVGIVRYTSAATTTIDVVAVFPELGSVRYGGPVVPDAHGDSVLTVTNGTGAFKGVTGTVTVGPGAETAANTFRLRIPGGGVDLSSPSPAA